MNRAIPPLAPALLLALISTVATGPLPAQELTVDVPDPVTWDSEGAYLGVRLEEETEYPEGGARVTEVVDDSPADEAGLKAGDIVVSFDEKVIRGPVALTQLIHGASDGDQVELTVVRDGKKETFEVELESRSRLWTSVPGIRIQGDPEQWEEWQEQLDERMQELGERFGKVYAQPQVRVAPRILAGLWGRPKLGVQLVETTPELRRHLGSTDDSGVLVSKVLEGMPAERAGIAVGDLIVSVDGEEVATSSELVAALADKEGEAFPVTVIRDGREQRLQVTIPEPDDERPTGPRAFVAPRPLPVAAPLPPAVRPSAPPVPPAAPHPPRSARIDSV